MAGGTGFTGGWVGKIQQAVTKGQAGKPYEAELQAAVDGMLRQAKGWVDGPEDKLIRDVIGKLKLEATLCEMPEPLLPDKLNDLSTQRRAKLLREAVALIEKSRS